MSIILERPVVFLDGGLGTTLEDQHGIRFSSDTPLWSSHLLITSPSTLSRVHTAFADAGADIILTATYQASFDGFSKTPIRDHGISRADAEVYMRSAVSIARSSFNSRSGIVALSLGAYGATTVPSTEYSGEYGGLTEQALISFHYNRLTVFLDHPITWTDIDVVAFETLPRLYEIRAVRHVASLIPSQHRKPYWISCVFPGNDDRLPDGSTIFEAVSVLLSGSKDDLPFAIGINCTKVYKLPRLIERFEEDILDAGFTFPRLVLYPDGAGGNIYNTQLQQWVETDPSKQKPSRPWDEEVFEVVRDVQSRGRWKGILLGGCCKTTPSHIAKLRQRLDSRSA